MTAPSRVSPPVVLTLGPEGGPIRAALDRLVAEDAEERGTRPDRQRSATVSALILAEDKRRARHRAAREGAARG